MATVVIRCACGRELPQPIGATLIDIAQLAGHQPSACSASGRRAACAVHQGRSLHPIRSDGDPWLDRGTERVCDSGQRRSATDLGAVG